MKLRPFYSKYRHFILYAFFGIVSTGLEFLVFALLYRIMPYLWANIIAFHCGLVCSFLLNRNINFKKEDKTVIRFASFYLVQVICLALNSLILYLCIDLGQWNPLIAKGFSIVLTALLPFFLNKYITFGKRI
ncbi:MAG: GtrA family protein [Bacteroidales bacterium]|nr:GtrA family protein [Bacteroidales bacterium]